MDTYEKKYKEIVGQIKKAYLYAQTDSTKAVLEEIFPELKESEDERIKESIIATIHLYYGEPLEDEAKEMLAWLEKQGEKKPDDKVEPKFKVGDWITNGDYIWKIVEVKPLDYVLQSQDGNIVDDTISHVDEQFHSFTIEDAKDGDVLCLYYNNRKTFFIFKAIIGEGDYADILVHCCYTGKYQYLEPSFNEECRMHQISDGGYCLPADKEEQGILFQKMKEAGYEWDAEKKELKKIEQKSQRMISAEAKEAMYDKPAWSEENEVRINRIVACLENLNVADNDILLKDVNWLKSLKQRIGG